MKKLLTILISCLLLSGLLIASVYGADTPVTPVTSASNDSSVNPSNSSNPEYPNFDYGIDIRPRYELWRNVFDFDDHGSKPDSDFFRLKTSLWGKLDIEKDLTLYLKLSNEGRYYLGSYSGKDLQKSEVIVDNLYLDAKHIFDSPLDLKIGRQDFLYTYGEGFLIMDGTPGDGSRTYYFNAAKATWHFDKDNSLDLVYIYDTKYDDQLPIINNVNTKINSSDERGLVLYGKTSPTENLVLEPYYIYKTEGALDSTGSDLELHTFGAHFVYQFDPWKLHGEYAHQFGEYENGTNRRGDGGYLFLDRKFKDTLWTPDASIGFAYLSGDDPNTTTVENWDPLFSRWPWLSELYILAYQPETKIIGYWTNLQAYRASVKLNFTPKTNLDIRYNYLRANDDPNITGSIFSNDGKERGHLPQLQLNHIFNPKVKSYILVEYLQPGNFYVSSADPAWFVRWEWQFKF